MVGEVTDKKSHVSNNVLLAILGVLIILIIALIIGVVVHNTINNVNQLGGDSSQTDGGGSGSGSDENAPGSDSGPSVSSGEGVGENDYGWPAESSDTNYVAYEDMTEAQKEAYDYVESTLRNIQVSRNGVIKLITQQGYSEEDATIVADSCGLDYDQNAVDRAALHIVNSTEYRDHNALVEALKMEGFTEEQAENAANQNNV